MTEDKDRGLKVILFTTIARLLYIAVLIPILNLVFYRCEVVIDDSMDYFNIWWAMINPWDARHFENIQEMVISCKITMHFSPLLTYIKSKIKLVILFEMTELIIGIILPYMLYKLTRTLYKSEPFAYYSSIFMALNFCSRFYISFYTEGIFSLISIVGFLVLIRGYTEDWISRVPYSKIIISFLLSMAVFCTSNGLFLCIVPGIFIFCKLYQNKTEIVKSLMISMLGVLVLAMFIYPFVMITRVIPYNMYCSPSVDETPLSTWCHLKYPDLYTDIQKKYWSSGFF